MTKKKYDRGPKPPPLSERRVFVRCESGEEVVLYPKRQQWRIELGVHGRDITFDQAVEAALKSRDAWIFYGQPGGAEFDFKVRAAKGLIEVTDRMVHARLADGTEIVRYNAASRWYAESPKRGVPRQGLLVPQAVKMVLDDPDSEVFFGRPGGSRFDRMVRLGGRM